MKALTAIALFLALSAVALAKPNLVERSRLALVNADINVGSLGLCARTSVRSELCVSGTILKRRNRRSTLALSLVDWSRTCSTRGALLSRAAERKA
mgnify:CR=1 FL=1